MSLPLWTAETQLALYDALGYRRGSPVQDRLLTDWTHRYHVVICPRRSSKSYTAAKKALPIILGRESLPDGQGPRPTKTWIVGATYELAEKEFRYIWQDLMVDGPRRLGWDRPILSRDSRKAGDLYMLTAWGSEVFGKSADKPQSLLGEDVDCLILAEAATLPAETWVRFLEPTLTTSRGYAIFPSTPDASALWLHELYVKGLEGNETIASYTWPVSGNPFYPMDEFERQRRAYGEQHPAFREQYLGEWTFYSGTVYGHDFDPNRNLIPPYDIPRDWRRIRAIDFGYRDPFVCLWFAVTPDGQLDCYREYYHTGRAMAEHAHHIQALTGTEPVLYTIADSSEAQSIADLRRLGIPALEANRDRRAGRMLVGDYLREGRLRFLRGACPHTLRELSFYQWDADKNKEGAKEMTLGDDHAMDAMRYAVMSRPQAPKSPYAIPRGSFAAEMQARKLARLRQGWPTSGVIG